jgi:hypothetical protein
MARSRAKVQPPPSGLRALPARAKNRRAG